MSNLAQYPSIVNKSVSVFVSRLSSRPLACDDFSCGVFRYPKAESIRKDFIETNAENSYGAMVLDIDYDFLSSLVWAGEELGLPLPQIAMVNPDNGHAHIIYLLASPVHLNPDSSQKAISLLRDVEARLSEAWRADPRYNGRLCKNPVNPHERFLVLTFGAEPYELVELLSLLPVCSVSKQQRKAEHSNTVIGRNCYLFECVRTYAYSQRCKVRSYAEFESVVGDYAERINAQFLDPLYASEVRSTVNSIVRWTWSHLSAGWADNRRGKSAETRGRARDDKAQRAITLYNQGMRISEIAEEIGVTSRTVSNYLRPLEEKTMNNGNAKSQEVRKQKAQRRGAEARRLWATGKYSQEELARKMGVSKRTICYDLSMH